MKKFFCDICEKETDEKDLSTLHAEVFQNHRRRIASDDTGRTFILRAEDVCIACAEKWRTSVREIFGDKVNCSDELSGR